MRVSRVAVELRRGETRGAEQLPSLRPGQLPEISGAQAGQAENEAGAARGRSKQENGKDLEDLEEEQMKAGQRTSG